MAALTGELRYLDIKNSICRQIYQGVYRDGEKIPSERQLALDYGVSRITVRKALELLEEDRLVSREVGNGTAVRLNNSGNIAPLDVVALVAPSKNPFFVEFIAAFQRTAWERGSLLLYVEVPEKTGIEDCLYQLYSKNIRNAVVWPDDQQADTEKLLCLRSIGMNLVFFDTDDAYPYADCVFLDNEDAVERIIRGQKKQYERYLFIGWDKLTISNVRKREEAFCRLCPGSEALRLPWRRSREVAEKDRARLTKAFQSLRGGLVICEVGELGELAAGILDGLGLCGSVGLASIDDFEGSGRYPASVYRQDLPESAECIYERLRAQTEENVDWKAGKYALKGQCVIA